MPATRVVSILTNGVRLDVTQAGPDDGPLAILLHGFPEGAYGMRRQRDALAAAGWRVWTPDQRGYGASAKPHAVAAYQLDQLASDVVGLMSAAGVTRACVAGHDWGALVAWWLAITRPECVARLAILNVPHPTAARWAMLRHPAQLWRSGYIAFFQIPWLPEALLRRDHWAPALHSLRASARPGTFSAADDAAYRAAWDQPGAMTAMLNWYRALLRFPPREPAQPRVRVPTLILWGQRDRFLLPALAAASAALCDDAQLVTFPTISHWVQHEAAAAVNGHLIRFFGDA